MTNFTENYLNQLDEAFVGDTHRTTVNGIEFQYWPDFKYRCSLAKNLKTGEIAKISGSGYIHQDLTVRKAIARVFRLPSFRK